MNDTDTKELLERTSRLLGDVSEEDFMRRLTVPKEDLRALLSCASRTEAAESQLAEANESLERVRRLAAEDSTAEQSKRLVAERELAEARKREKTLTRALAEAVTDKELLENLKRELAETSKQCEQYRLETHRWADAVKKDRIERDKQFATISTQAAENATLRSLLKELYATVKGECPSLFNEESGNARLDAEIEAALTQPQPEGQNHE